MPAADGQLLTGRSDLVEHALAAPAAVCSSDCERGRQGVLGRHVATEGNYLDQVQDARITQGSSTRGLPGLPGTDAARSELKLYARPEKQR